MGQSALWARGVAWVKAIGLRPKNRRSVWGGQLEHADMREGLEADVARSPKPRLADLQFRVRFPCRHALRKGGEVFRFRRGRFLFFPAFEVQKFGPRR